MKRAEWEELICIVMTFLLQTYSVCRVQVVFYLQGSSSILNSLWVFIFVVVGLFNTQVVFLCLSNH